MAQIHPSSKASTPPSMTKNRSFGFSVSSIPAQEEQGIRIISLAYWVVESTAVVFCYTVEFTDTVVADSAVEKLYLQYPNNFSTAQ